MSKFIWTEDTVDGFNVVMSFSTHKINVKLENEKWRIGAFSYCNLIARNSVFDSICRIIGDNDDYIQVIMSKKVNRNKKQAEIIARHTCKTMYKHFVKQAAKRMQELTDALDPEIVKFHKKLFSTLGPSKYKDCNLSKLDRKVIGDSPVLIHLAFDNEYGLKDILYNKDKNMKATIKNLKRFSSRLNYYFPLLKFKKSYSNLNELAFSIYSNNINQMYVGRDTIKKNKTIILDKFLDVKAKDIKKAMNIYNSFTKENLNMRKLENIEKLCDFIFPNNFNENNIVELTKKVCNKKLMDIQQNIIDKNFVDSERTKIENFEDKYITHLDTNQKIIDCGLNFGKNLHYVTLSKGNVFYIDYCGEKSIICVYGSRYITTILTVGGDNKKSVKYAEKIFKKWLKNDSSCPF